MRRILDVPSQELIWRQRQSFKRDYALHAGEEVLATLRWTTAFGSLAEATTAEGQWTFKRVGFWRPQVTVRVPGSETNLAVFEPSWTGSGTLRLAEGRTVRWGQSNFWQTQWAWQGADEQPLINFKSKMGLTKTEGIVEIAPQGLTLPDLELLVPLGWYLLRLYIEDSSAAA